MAARRCRSPVTLDLAVGQSPVGVLLAAIIAAGGREAPPSLVGEGFAPTAA